LTWSMTSDAAVFPTHVPVLEMGTLVKTSCVTVESMPVTDAVRCIAMHKDVMHA
jgi:hypothetical protein